MKKLFTLFLVLISINSFGQGNFTLEWESPAGWESTGSSGILKLNSSSNIYHIICNDVNDEHSLRFYNGSTHANDYSWSWTGTWGYFSATGIRGLSYDAQGEFFTNKFDVNGDGINEFIQTRNSNLDKHIVNPVNGNSLYSTTDDISAIIDIDGDGYLEIIQHGSNPSTVRIISTPVQTVSVENNNEVAKNYELKQNYPNPFNPTTTIEYTLNKNSDVKIIIYNVLGKEVNTLVNQKQISGTYKLNLNGNDLTSGTYFYSLIVDGVVESKKMILIK